MTRRRRQQRRRRERRGDELAWAVPEASEVVFARPDALLVQAASNTLGGVDAPPRPLARWLDWVALTPACWGLLAMVCYVAVSGVRSLDWVVLCFGLGALFQVGALVQRVRSRGGAWRPGGGARVDHVTHDLLVQILARCGTREGAWADSLARVQHARDGWFLRVGLDAHGAAATLAFQLGAPAADAPDTLALSARAVGPHNPWSGARWPDGAAPTVERDAADGAWRLTLTLEDPSGARRRYAAGEVGLRATLDAQSEAWAEHVAAALLPLLRAPQRASFEEVARVSAWGRAREPALEALECPRRGAAEVLLAHAGARCDVAQVEAAWRAARWAARGRRFCRAVALTPLALVAGVMGAGEWLTWAALACCGGAVLWLHACFERMIDPSTRPPAQPRLPRVAPARALTWDGRLLTLGDDALDLARPFACALARSGDAEGRAFVVVELIERGAAAVGAGARARVRFQVEVEASDAWARLDRLEAHAPTVSGDAFDAWVWPLIRHQHALHATRDGLHSAGRAQAEAAAAAPAPARAAAPMLLG